VTYRLPRPAYRLLLASKKFSTCLIYHKILHAFSKHSPWDYLIGQTDAASIVRPCRMDKTTAQKKKIKREGKQKRNLILDVHFTNSIPNKLNYIPGRRRLDYQLTIT
jgi:hypothetical protein